MHVQKWPHPLSTKPLSKNSFLIWTDLIWTDDFKCFTQANIDGKLVRDDKHNSVNGKSCDEHEVLSSYYHPWGRTISVTYWQCNNKYASQVKEKQGAVAGDLKDINFNKMKTFIANLHYYTFSIFRTDPATFWKTSTAWKLTKTKNSYLYNWQQLVWPTKLFPHLVNILTFHLSIPSHPQQNI